MLMLMLTTLLWKYDPNITNWNRNSSVAQFWFHVTTILLSKPSLNHLDVHSRCGFLSKGTVWELQYFHPWRRSVANGGDCVPACFRSLLLCDFGLIHYDSHVSDFDSELQTEDNRWSFYFYSIYEELHSWWFHFIQISQMTLVQFYLYRNKSQQRVPQSASKTQH